MKVSKFAIAALLAGLTAVTLVSCDENSGNKPEPNPYELVAGSYAGTMTSAPTQPAPAPTAQEGEDGEGGQGGEESKGESVNLDIKEKEVVFASFPIAGLVTSIVGEDGAAAIIEALGDVEYKLPFTAAFNDAGTEIAMTLAPRELKITIPAPPQPAPTAEESEEPQTVEVTVTVGAGTPGKYEMSYGGPNKLVFALEVEKVVVGETELDNFVQVTLTFDMEQAKK